MKIALAQINTTIADFEGNYRKIARFVEKAKFAKADLIAFPEMTITGYPPRDLVENPAFVERNLKTLEDVARLSADMAIIVGYIDRHEGVGKPLMNTAALCREGRIEARYAKTLLPTYDVFDEGRYFEAGTESGVWSLGSAKIGISICEDSWNDKNFWDKRTYPKDPIEEEVTCGAQILINISASPYSRGKVQFRREMLRAVARRHRRPLFYVNLVGGNDELVFDGRSFVINAQGEIVEEGAAYREDLIVVDTDSLPTSLPSAMNDWEDITQTLTLGVHDYVKKCGFKKVVLGLSGGIDSALTAVIAVKALGAKNVLGVAMPSLYSSKESLQDARALAKNLGISFKEFSITDLYQAYRKIFKRDKTTRPDLADENVQARIRGNILMTLSNRYGHLVLSTGNKSELAMGYCTLYGDMSGGLSVISDLPKTMVYEVARHLQKKKAVIPESTFTKAPSAELRPKQTDQDSLPPYEILDPILKAVIEEGKSAEDLVQMGFEKKLVQWIVRKIHQNEYKRRQAAPGIKLSARAFGIGRRYPIARKV